MTQLSAGRVPDAGPGTMAAPMPGAVLDGVVDALNSERRLIEELTTIMRAQREAVGRDDLQAVDDSVHSVQRVLFTLGEARKRRRLLNRRMGRPEDAPLRELDEALGAQATPAFRQAREGLQRAARTLSEEVAVNRKLLREALAAGDEHVRHLYGAGDAQHQRVGYPEAGPPPAVHGGLLLNRRA